MGDNMVRTIAALTTLVLIARTSFACICDVSYTPNVSEKFDEAVIVFRAKVTKVEELSSRTNIRDVGWVGRTIRVAWFQVIDTYKGDPLSIEAIASATSTPACGIPLDEGDEYIFFSDEIGQVSSCGGSRSRQTAAHFGYSWEDFLVRVESFRQHERLSQTKDR